MSSFDVFTPELLSEIFLIASRSWQPSKGLFDYSTWAEPDDITFFRPCADTTPCRLSMVCKHWNRVALSTPRLWSYLKLQTGYYERSGQAEHVNRPWSWWIPRKDGGSLSGRGYVDTSIMDDASYARYWEVALSWIRRSQNAPLALYLELYPNKPLPQELLATMSRWQIVHMVGSNTRGPVVIDFPFEPASFQIASRIEWLEMDIQMSDSDMTLCLEGLSNLKYLRTANELDPNYQHPYPLDTLSGILDPEGCLRTLLALPKLRALDVTLIVSHPQDVRDLVSVTSSLTNFDCKGPTRTLGSFFSYLELPELQRANIEPTGFLCVEDNNLFWTDFGLPLKRFLQHSSLSLTYLRLDSAYLHEWDALTLLQVVPRLTYLKLTIWRLTEVGLRALTRDADGSEGAVCPELSDLHLSSLRGSKISIARLTRMLQSRLEMETCTSLGLFISLNPEDLLLLDHDLKQLQELFSGDPRLILRISGPGHLWENYDEEFGESNP